MRGIIQIEPGNEKSLTIDDSIPIPVPESREVLIRVNFAALNRMDLLKAKAAYPSSGSSGKESADILGIEVSGSIIACGDNCELGFQMGDSVCALLKGGVSITSFVVLPVT